MSKFKVGDRVKYIGYYIPLKGKIGTIVLRDNDFDAGVEFDDRQSFLNNLHGFCENHYGWYCRSDELELIKDEPRFNVIITSVGDVTTAKLLHGEKVEKEVSVKRYFKDEYSEKADVEAVCKKLFGEDKPKKKLEPKGINCKAVYIGNKGLGFTRGVVYQFIDGRCIDDQGYLRPSPKFNLYGIIDENEVWFAEDFVKLVGDDE